jgi:DNA-binding beta-propeller fold protein YncE
MTTTALRLRQGLTEWDREKLKKTIRILVILQLIIWLLFYWMNRNPFHMASQYLPGRTEAPRFLFSIYGATEDDIFEKPMAVTVSGTRIYVADTENQRIQVYDYNGNLLFKFGKYGTGMGEFRFPYGIAVAKDGRIFVADMYNDNISVFSPSGDFLNYFGSSLDVGNPAGLAIDGDRLYLTDLRNHRVVILDLDNAEKIFEFGSEGRDEREFRSPNAIAVSNTQIFVSDTANDRIQVFNKLGDYQRTMNQENTGRNFLNPRGIGVDPQGVLYVVNNLTHNVFGFSQRGEFLYDFGGMGQAPGNFFLPNGLYIDNQGRIYVTDTINRRINVYF